MPLIATDPLTRLPAEPVEVESWESYCAESDDRESWEKRIVTDIDNFSDAQLDSLVNWLFANEGELPAQIATQKAELRKMLGLIKHYGEELTIFGDCLVRLNCVLAGAGILTFDEGMNMSELVRWRAELKTYLNGVFFEAEHFYNVTVLEGGTNQSAITSRIATARTEAKKAVEQQIAWAKEAGTQEEEAPEDRAATQRAIEEAERAAGREVFLTAMEGFGLELYENPSASQLEEMRTRTTTAKQAAREKVLADRKDVLRKQDENKIQEAEDRAEQALTAVVPVGSRFKVDYESLLRCQEQFDAMIHVECQAADGQRYHFRKDVIDDLRAWVDSMEGFLFTAIRQILSKVNPRGDASLDEVLKYLESITRSESPVEHGLREEAQAILDRVAHEVENHFAQICIFPDSDDEQELVEGRTVTINFLEAQKAVHAYDERAFKLKALSSSDFSTRVLGRTDLWPGTMTELREHNETYGEGSLALCLDVRVRRPGSDIFEPMKIPVPAIALLTILGRAGDKCRDNQAASAGIGVRTFAKQALGLERYGHLNIHTLHRIMMALNLIDEYPIDTPILSGGALQRLCPRQVLEKREVYVGEAVKRVSVLVHQKNLSHAATGCRALDDSVGGENDVEATCAADTSALSFSLSSPGQPVQEEQLELRATTAQTGTTQTFDEKLAQQLQSEVEQREMSPLTPPTAVPDQPAEGGTVLGTEKTGLQAKEQPRGADTTPTTGANPKKRSTICSVS